jgi:hypothetical protein
MRNRVATFLLLSLSLVACVASSDDDVNDPSGGKADGRRTILLDCNTALGPDQQVTVLDDGGSLTLRELTTSGAQVERPLDDAEWQSGMLRLRDDGFGSTSMLTKEDGDWFLSSTGGGFNEFGFADCVVDESP